MTEEKTTTDVPVEEKKVHDAVLIEEGASPAFVVDPAKEKLLVRKLDRAIIPWVTCMYLLSYLDRVNIGNARVVNSNSAGVGEMEADLGLAGNQYNWALSIFFVGYVIFEIPSNLLLKRLHPSRWLARIMVSWGICATCLASVNSWATLMVVRFLLGIMEAGLFPGVLFYLSFWYRKHELARRMSWFFAAASGAGAFGGVLAFAISYLDNRGGLQGWQWVFIIEGVPTILFGIVIWFVLPDFPGNAKFLNEEERILATERMKLENNDPNEKEFSWPQFKSSVTDLKVWSWMLIYIGLLVPLYSISFFLPTINKGLGFTSINAQAMSVPPFACACIASIATGYSSDYFKDRSSHVMAGTLLGSISFFSLAYVRNNPALYALTIFAAIGVFSTIATSLSWLSNNMIGSTRGATALAMMVSFGNIGGVISGQIYRSSDSPSYTLGHVINGSFMLWSFTLSFLLRMYLNRVNNKKDTLYGKNEVKKDVNGKDGIAEVVGEDDARFRHQL